MSLRSVDMNGDAPGVRGAAMRSARALIVAGGLVALSIAGASAQATPESGSMATPADGPCEAPAGMTDMASPMASPEADDAEAPVGTPVEDQAVIDQAVAAAENLANCWNAGDLEAVLGLVTPNLLQTKFGVASADEAATALSSMELPLYAIVSTGDVQTYDDGRASLDLDYMLGDHQFSSARWYMVDAGGQLLIDEEEFRLPQPDVEASSVIGLAFESDDSAIVHGVPDAETGGREVPAIEGIILNLANAGTENRILTVVRLGDDETASPVAGPLPMGDFVAMVHVPGGGQTDVALLNLEPGNYAVGEMGGDSVPLTITEAAA
ncbi:MAG: hypothetical protein M3354_03015 [Chloroflexota bacterium]|nr:hypothetical protein [Chloroflexota bacterium]